MIDADTGTQDKKQKNRHWIYYVLPVLILGGGFALMQLLAAMNEEAPRRQPPRIIKPVLAEVVTLTRLPVTIEALGRVVSSHPVQLVSEVAGNVERGDVPFKPGQRFRRGQALLRIDNRQIELSLNSTKSDFLNALASVLPELKVDFPADFALWQRYFDASSFDHTLADLPETTNRSIKLLLTRTQVYKLYFAVRTLEITLEKHTIRAPFNGAIISTALREGSSARSGLPLGEIISLQDMEIELPLLSSELQWINNNSSVSLHLNSEQTWTGTIARIGSVVDKRTQTVPVYVGVNGTHGLVEGMYVTATIPGRMLEQGATVPRRAVYDNKYVYLVKDGILVERAVDVIGAGSENVIVSNGLAEGDTLITELLQGVAPGMPVQARLAGTEIRKK